MAGIIRALSFSTPIRNPVFCGSVGFGKEAYDLTEQGYTQENAALAILGNNILYYLYNLK